MRKPPAISAAFREEVGLVGKRISQGRPLVTVAPMLLLIPMFGEDSALWRMFPFLAGLAYGMGIWSNRALGRSVGWELPVDRTTGNVLRNLAGLLWSLTTVAVLVPLAALLLGGVYRSQPIAGILTALGAATLSFAALSAGYQQVSARRRYLFPLGLLVFMPFGILPTRVVLGMLPDPVEPVVSGRFGLTLFTGKFLFERVRPGMVPTTWSLENWLISAAIWIPVSLGLLLLASATHQE